MSKLIALTVVQAKLFIREPAAFFFTLIFPLLLIVMFGLVFGNEPGESFPGPFGYVDYSTPAMTAPATTWTTSFDPDRRSQKANNIRAPRILIAFS